MKAATVSGADLDHLVDVRRRHVVPVDQPMVLISQVQRSGGTLLARLFDGHEQCHVHPFELHIGSPARHRWPRLDPEAEPRVWFAMLREERLAQMFQNGQRRTPTKGKGKPRRESTTYPFMLPPTLQRALFMEQVAARGEGVTTERAILDCYLTSLFNAWLDNQNLYGADKRWVVAFAPRLAYGDGGERFFAAYPDGRLISLIRDPHGWFTSARGRERPDSESRASTDRLIERWTVSAREALKAKEAYGDRVYVVGFDALVTETEETMRALAGYLDIEFTPQLTQPTFNRYPIGANSSFAVTAPGVISDPVRRHEDVLTDAERERLTQECGPLYEQVLEVSDRALGV
jgi:hypothetical protein